MEQRRKWKEYPADETFYFISVICKTDGGELAGEAVGKARTAQDKHRGDSIPIIQVADCPSGT